MNRKNEISTLKAWLLVLASLIDDAVVLGLIFLGLWAFHIKITLAVILTMAAVMAVFIVIMHKAVIPALKRRKVTGAEGMIGAIGTVTAALDPVGMVDIGGEHWKASGVNGKIGTGVEVEVVAITGLKLVVKEISHD
jgi:membrane-bound ClpP family serine protease